jgi:CheY-like chemotaxis protein
MTTNSIVLVEDNYADVLLFREAIREVWDEPCLQHFADGPEAIAGLLPPRQPEPALIVLDLNLPRLSGAYILGRLRAEPAYRDTRIIVLTSSERPNDRAECLEKGADLYLIKPQDYDEFIETLRLNVVPILREHPPVVPFHSVAAHTRGAA